MDLIMWSGWIIAVVITGYFWCLMKKANKELQELREQKEKTEFALYANQGLLKEVAEKEMAFDILTYINKLADEEIIDTQKISDALGYKKEKVDAVVKKVLERKE